MEKSCTSMTQEKWTSFKSHPAKYTHGNQEVWKAKSVILCFSLVWMYASCKCRMTFICQSRCLAWYLCLGTHKVPGFSSWFCSIFQFPTAVSSGVEHVTDYFILSHHSPATCGLSFSWPSPGFPQAYYGKWNNRQNQSLSLSPSLMHKS